jgi:hypothetical protein
MVPYKNPNNAGLGSKSQGAIATVKLHIKSQTCKKNQKNYILSQKANLYSIPTQFHRASSFIKPVLGTKMLTIFFIFLRKKYARGYNHSNPGIFRKKEVRIIGRNTLGHCELSAG